jgi:uncharacterized lipoprotein YehR (DUF1307 family)
MKVYITKYWQTKGIIEAETMERQAEDTKYMWARSGERYKNLYTLGRDIFYTEYEAISCIRIKVKKKIAELEKTLIKLKNIFP